MKKQILLWQIAGIFIIFFLGFLWHFIYSLSGNLWFIALIAPVNESVWEHLKLAQFPFLLFSILQFFYIGRFNDNFVPARTAALYVIPIIIVTLHYSYRNILGHPVLWLDILIFGLSISIGQLISYYLMLKAPFPNEWRNISLIAILILFIIFAVLTCNPPHWSIFLDSSTGKYGL
ncbi:MAG: hypothetical protein CVU90_08615 [Firmicutes bacterium HGW-Firmicutes-15]|nr:MAG: hypothetical protein CVU90_08615 [Firmicutes bacterium HGW-Firmicutes-15]